ncbi:hypothetical protein ABVK25_007777 [Lepraria finkii]|uniref:Heterokaryon incompatibility domain-containing protein n=1 Tax=Lepraria finkii TaxID=1340010 RepID=A0ABR4B1U2_9LECA
MAWTRLLHVETGCLEQVSIDQILPFIAISHTWAEALFPANIPFPQQPGAKAIKCLFSQSFPNVQYCWIDTLCIDQADPEDKKRQIPLMGEIYGKAEAVAIISGTPIGLTQEEIDCVTERVEDAVEMYREENWKSEGEKWETGQRRQFLKEAMDCLELFTRSPWATRVWTLQEFVLAKSTIWIGGDLTPLRISEELFLAIPDICETLKVAECIMGKYSILYHHYRGMAGARLGQIDRTRVMELLGNRTASLPVDEVFGTMAASGVVIEQLGVQSREEAWHLWWEKAVTEGHVRWALLPPAVPGLDGATNQREGYHNCAMPACSKRHLASSSSGLDTVTPLGPVEVEGGTVTMDGRWAGVCKPIRRLGRVHQDTNGLLHRDITLILFASNNWTLSLRVARAFGGGRYTRRKIFVIAQVLKHNFYRAQLAVLSHTEDDFRPRFRNQYYKFIWSDFMLLQSGHMMIMNEGVSFLAELQNDVFKADIVVVTEGRAPPSGRLMAVDFGAVSTSGRTLLTVVEIPEDLVNRSAVKGHESLSYHKMGVAMALEVRDLDNARKYSAFALSDTNIYRFSVGGSRCIGCRRGNSEVGNAAVKGQVPTMRLKNSVFDERSRRSLRSNMRRQTHALGGLVECRSSLRQIRNKRKVKLRMRSSNQSIRDSLGSPVGLRVDSDIHVM